MKKKPERLKRFWVAPDNVDGCMSAAGQYIRENVADGLMITLRRDKEKRRDVQNDLAHYWKGIAAVHHHLKLDYVWGAWKLDHLLDIKLSEPGLNYEARREQAGIYGATALMKKQWAEISDEPYPGNREMMVELSYENIRSSDLPVKVFAKWLQDIQTNEAINGLQLVTTEDEHDEALWAMNLKNADDFDI